MNHLYPCYVKKDCGPIKDPVHGHCKVTGEYYGDSATYICDDGYALYGGDTIRKCGDDGYWAGKAPICKRCKLQSQEIL